MKSWMVLATLVAFTPPGHAQHAASASNMALLGHHDLQGRSAYQPVIHEQNGRWIAYVGHHGGRAVNSLTGREEDSGTSIVDVTDPRKPRYLAHIPGEPGQAETGGAQMARVCSGKDLPKADKSKFYLLRSFGNLAHEVWDVTLPEKPSRIAVVVDSLKGAHTTLPLIGIEMAEFAKDKGGNRRDFVVVVNESLVNECLEPRQMAFIVDVTDEKVPVGVSTFNVPEASGNFCSRGGRFGSHSSNENQPPMHAGRTVFMAWFNAGVRAVDIRDPFHRRELGSYIPATTDNTDKRCVKAADGGERCKLAIQTNNLDVDDRGYIYIVDRANTGMHILELSQR